MSGRAECARVRALRTAAHWPKNESQCEKPYARVDSHTIGETIQSARRFALLHSPKIPARIKTCAMQSCSSFHSITQTDESLLLHLNIQASFPLSLDTKPRDVDALAQQKSQRVIDLLRRDCASSDGNTRQAE